MPSPFQSLFKTDEAESVHPEAVTREGEVKVPLKASKTAPGRLNDKDDILEEKDHQLDHKPRLSSSASSMYAQAVGKKAEEAHAAAQAQHSSTYGPMGSPSMSSRPPSTGSSLGSVEPQAEPEVANSPPTPIQKMRKSDRFPSDDGPVSHAALAPTTPLAEQLAQTTAQAPERFAEQLVEQLMKACMEEAKLGRSELSWDSIIPGNEPFVRATAKDFASRVESLGFEQTEWWNGKEFRLSGGRFHITHDAVYGRYQASLRVRWSVSDRPAVESALQGHRPSKGAIEPQAEPEVASSSPMLVQKISKGDRLPSEEGRFSYAVTATTASFLEQLAQTTAQAPERLADKLVEQLVKACFEEAKLGRCELAWDAVLPGSEVFMRLTARDFASRVEALGFEQIEWWNGKEFRLSEGRFHITHDAVFGKYRVSLRVRWPISDRQMSERNPQGFRSSKAPVLEKMPEGPASSPIAERPITESETIWEEEDGCLMSSRELAGI